jgi:hypothetical protein
MVKGSHLTRKYYEGSSSPLYPEPSAKMERKREKENMRETGSDIQRENIYSRSSKREKKKAKRQSMILLKAKRKLGTKITPRNRSKIETATDVPNYLFLEIKMLGKRIFRREKGIILPLPL